MAESDINNIVDYIALDSPQIAKKFGEELRNKTLPLTQHPQLGRKGRPGLPNWLRELVIHPNYIIFYRVLDKTRAIEILRIKHTSQRKP